LIDRLLGEAAILEQVFAPLRPGRRGELLAKVGECDLVRFVPAPESGCRSVRRAFAPLRRS
jgi:hypothetical protein